MTGCLSLLLLALRKKREFDAASYSPFLIKLKVILSLYKNKKGLGVA